MNIFNDFSSGVRDGMNLIQERINENNEQEETALQDSTRTVSQYERDSLEIGDGCSNIGTGIIQGIVSFFCVTGALATGGISYILGSLCCVPSATLNFVNGIAQIIRTAFFQRPPQNN